MTAQVEIPPVAHGSFAGVPFPKPGQVLILTCDEDGARFWITPSLETFAGTDWGNFPALVADGKAALMRDGEGST